MTEPVLALSLPREVLALGALTGLGYGLVAVGLVLTYRASRVVNFAHGQIGALAAVVMALVHQRWGIPYWEAFATALVVGAGLSALTDVVVIRRLRGSPAILSLVATLGVSAALYDLTLSAGNGLATGTLFPMPAGLPSTRFGALVITPAAWGLLVLSPLAVAVLAWFLQRTATGAAVLASASSPEGARVLGIRAPRMATIAWAVAGALAALTAALVLPAGAIPTPAALGPALLLRALTAAALARMTSLPIAFGAGIAIGVAEHVTTFNTPADGATDLILFAVLVIAVLVRPPAAARMAQREDWAGPTARRTLSPGARAVPLVRYAGGATAACALVAAASMAFVLHPDGLLTLTTVVCLALVGVSAWLVGGLGGQLSLAQLAFAGIGAVFLVGITDVTGSPLLGLISAPVAGATAAFVVGVPALRVHGIMFAACTLAFALATSSWLMPRSWALTTNGVAVTPLRIGAWRVDTPAGRYGLALAALIGGLVVTGNIARGGFGRRLRAVRDNEQAARSLGIPATLVRLQAFAVSGALAAAAGAALTLALDRISPQSFPGDGGVQAVAMAVVGGLAVSWGALPGALYLVALPAFGHLSSGSMAALSFGWLALLLLMPGGLAALVEPLRARTLGWLLRVSGQGHIRALIGDTEQPGEPLAQPPAEALLAPAAPLGATPSGQPALALEGLRLRYGSLTVLDGVDLAVEPGAVLGVIGPNGAGKTTLFDVASGLVAPDAGRVVLGGRDVTALPASARAARGLVRSFQDAALFSTLTTAEVVALGLERAEPSRLMTSMVGGRRADRGKRARARELIALLGLEPWADTRVHALSTGTRRVVEIACILAARPAVVLLDEPSAGLAHAETVALRGMLEQLRAATGVTMVIIEHDLPLVMGLADRVAVLAEGRVVCVRAPADLGSEPEAMRAMGVPLETVGVAPEQRGAG